MLLYHLSCIRVSFYFLVHCTGTCSWFSNWRPSTIFDFKIFVKKIQIVAFSTSTCKIWWRSDDPRPSYCAFSIFKMRPSAILDFHIFSIFAKHSNLRLIFASTCKICWILDDPWPIAYFRFSKWRPSAILDFLWRHSGPPTICVSWP